MFGLRKVKMYIWIISIVVAYICGYNNMIREKTILATSDKMLNSFCKVTGKNTFENICYQQLYKGKISSNKCKEIALTIMKKLDGDIVDIDDGEEESEYGTVIYGFTDKINDTINVRGKLTNVNMIFKYNDKEDTTRIYMSAPIMNLEY